MEPSAKSTARLVVVRLAPDEPHNAKYSNKHYSRRRWRWGVRAHLSDGRRGLVPALADNVYPSYTKAIEALHNYLADSKSGRRKRHK